MNRKIKYGARLIYNMVRLPIKSAFSFGRIKGSMLQLISPLSKLDSEKGEILLRGRLVAEGNVYIHAVAGSILIEDVFINRNSCIVAMDRIEIGPGVTIGPNVCIYDHDHSLVSSHEKPYITAPVKIGKKAWIGANVVVLKGVTIGENAVVAAGAVVTKDVPKNTIVGGVPARVIREMG